MNDKRKTKKELIQELDKLKRRIFRLEKSAAGKSGEKSTRRGDLDYKHIFENAHDAMVCLDTRGYIIEASKKAIKFFGGTKRELIGKHFTKIGIFSPKDIPGLLSRFKTILTGKHSNINLQIKNKNQRVFFLECSISLMRIGNKITGMTAVVRDVTERKSTESELRAERDKLNAIFESMVDGAYIVNKDHDIQYVNPVLKKDFGPPEGKKCHKYFHDSDEPCAFCKNKDVFAGKMVRWEWTSPKNGKIYDLIDTPLKNPDGSISKLEIFRDITERKRAEEALRESYEIINLSPAVAFLWRNAEGWPVEYVSENVKKLFGYTAEDFMSGKVSYAKIIHPDDLERVREEVARYSGEKERMNFAHKPYRIVTKSGQIRWIDDRINIRRGKNGMITHYRGIVLDITGRKRAEEALWESEEHYRLLVENATEGILVAQDGFVKFANPRLEEITSYKREELLSRPFLEFLHPNDRKFVIDNQLKRLKGELVPEAYEIRIITKYGDTRWLKISGVIITWEGRPALLNFIVDITEKKRLKELESRAQRLEAAGQMAGQVAHDFNNLLAPLIAYPEFIRDELPHDHKALVYLNDIEKAAHQIAGINQHLLTLGRRGHYNLVPLNLNDVIGETLDELKPFPETLVIETDLGGELLNIKAGRAQIHRMLSNIIANARDAMQDIGRIVIKTENYYADSMSVAYGYVSKGEYVKLTISDTGHGISEDVIQKIFDPFFTTKTADRIRGSGLGLSVVDAVVKDHNGYLDLYSKVGEGTSFILYFPITRENIDDQESEQIIGGSESVLVVDDDDVQRKVSLKILTSLGYKAATVESGEKAIELLRHKPYDLLFLDMIMTPGIDGTETLRRALEINPAQKTIILSGFAESQRVQEALELGAGAFIRKPLTRKKMAAAVRKELDKEEKVLVQRKSTIMAVK